ncbi:TcfC E-set like domain-containing protein [Endozoicomonas sp. SCSIO W0465]|uniref:TcfC E-set like domain-containing protein n=1 Tax=Endozoicomonas sp. SCSIO W0465 TaxID=2918516 RepID=UPI0020762D18|nr:TcfC E-set like domain-containing protein [Endozoicomonas sp. SCSIO W0465]USE36872.1 TcfC E-set like domain-containing protein [Endozoicomonas sp. SCSIO W0465]
MKAHSYRQNKGISLLAICSVFVGSVSLSAVAEVDNTLPAAKPKTPFGLELSQIPEEFRDMAEPQTTVADFYYGGRYLTSTTVAYTPDTITIADPRALLDRISTIARPDAVTAALSGEIFSNPSQVCMQAGDTQCGTLNPAVAGVIFDATRFRGDIFIAEPYLQVQTIQQSKYLPDSNSSLGMIQGLSAVSSGVTGLGDSENNYSLFGNTLVGWQENHLVANWDYSRDNSFQIDTLYLARDARGLQMGGGFLDSSGVMTPQFAGSQQVLGVKLGSSMNSRLDTADISSTPIRIFTNGRRRVEVLRDNRLIYATSLEAGSQEIDTRSFPQGSYNVTIRIYNGSVLEQELTRFYSKSVRLPPSDELLWYLEGGQMTERDEDETLPENLEEWLLRGGVARRVTDSSSLELRGAATDDEQSVEAEYFYQGDGWDIAMTGMVGSNSAKGLVLETSAALGPVHLSYFHQRLWNDDYPSNLDAGEENPVRLLDESYESRSLSLSTSLLGGNLSGSYSYNQQIGNEPSLVTDEDDETTIYSLSWSRNVAQFGDYDLDLELDYSESDGDKAGNIGLTLRHSTPDWNYDIRGEGRWEQDQGQPSDTNVGYALDSRWYQEEILHGSGELGVRYDDLSGDQRLLGGDIKYEHARFLGELSADYIDPTGNQGNQESYTNYNGRIETSFAINAEGAGIGGGNRADSAVMVGIEGSPSARFDVTVNGSNVGIATGDSNTVVPLSPYGTYRVGIRPRGDEFYRYDQGERSITLYPGNVESVSFSAQEELILLGKLVNRQGDALGNVTIPQETGFARTDQFGIFQMSMTTKDNKLRVNLAEGKTCTATIPENYQKRGGVGLVGTLKCL